MSSDISNPSTSKIETTTSIIIKNITARLNPISSPLSSLSTSTVSNKNDTANDDDALEIPHIFNVFEDYPWLLWVIIVVITIIVVGIVITICYCLVHNKKKLQKNQQSFIRHNSASNMNPFSRSQPLPPIKGQQLQKIRPETSPQPVTLGINISNVKGVPEIKIPPESRRPLPPIRPKTT